MLSYSQALDILNSLTAERPDRVFNESYLLDSLARARRVLNLLGSSQNKLKIVHVAGSKGKGSVCLMLSAMIAELGFRVGLYTSPHIVSVRERICLNNCQISEDKFAFYVQEIVERIGLDIIKELTYFEFLTVLALTCFAGEGLEYAVLEVGLGGRFDATNVVLPVAGVLTSIELEHTAVLGETIEKIAREKLGIVKARAPLFVGRVPKSVSELAREVCLQQHSELFEVFRDVSFKINKVGLAGSKFLYIGAERKSEVLLSLPGEKQVENACLALRVMEYLFAKDIFDDYAQALGKITSLSRFNYRRFQDCEVIFDAAHTIVSTASFLDTYEKIFNGRSKVFVFSIMKDKAVDQILDLIAKSKPQQIVFTSVDLKRAVEADVLRAEFSRIGSDVQVFCEKSSMKAFEMALSLAKPNGAVVCVIGSNYLIGEILASLRKC